MVGEGGFEPPASASQTRRAPKLRYSPEAVNETSTFGTKSSPNGEARSAERGRTGLTHQGGRENPGHECSQTGLLPYPGVARLGRPILQDLRSLLSGLKRGRLKAPA